MKALLRALSPDGDTSTELRNTRFWDRTRRVLDTADGGKLGSAARQLISEAEPAELGVLLQELQPYLQARGQDGTGWIGAAVAQAVPELAAAKAQLMKAEQAHQIVTHNAEVVARSIAQGSITGTLVDPAAYDPDAK